MMNENIKAMELREDELENVVGGAITKEDIVKIIDKSIRDVPVVGPIVDLFRHIF